VSSWRVHSSVTEAIRLRTLGPLMAPCQRRWAPRDAGAADLIDRALVLCAGDSAFGPHKIAASWVRRSYELRLAGSFRELPRSAGRESEASGVRRDLGNPFCTKSWGMQEGRSCYSTPRSSSRVLSIGTVLRRSSVCGLLCSSFPQESTCY
jgi:hypothetical protein